MYADETDSSIRGSQSNVPGGGTLKVAVSQRDDVVVLSVVGTVDMLTAAQVTDAVTGALADKPGSIVIDLLQTDFLASAGMTALIAAHEHVTTVGKLAVVADGPSTARPLQLMGLDKVLAIYPTVDAAVAAIGVTS